MHFIQHNSDTSIKVFAKTLNEKLKEITQLYANKEINTVQNSLGVVSIVDSSLKNDLEKLVQKLDSTTSDAKEFLPKILITKSNTINPSSYGMSQMKYAQKEEIEIYNLADVLDTVLLEGTWFEYDIPIQILIVTRVGYANRELSLELMRILFEMRRTYYSLRVFDDVNPSLVYQLDDYGKVDILDFENKPFGQEVAGENNSIIINTIDFIMRESYFKLSEANVYEDYRIETSVSIIEHKATLTGRISE